MWHVVVTDADENDFKVSEALHKAGLTPFLPYIMVSRRNKRGLMQSTANPVYRGYLFCNTHGAPFEGILRVKGVNRVLMMCGTDRPAEIPSEQIDEIRALCDEKGRMAGRGKKDVAILKGMVGRSIAMPMMGIPFEARANQRNGRVNVNFNVDGKSMRANVPVESLEVT